MIRDVLQELDSVESALVLAPHAQREALLTRRSELLDACTRLTAEDKVFLARMTRRPKAKAFIDALFTDFFEQRGDRQSKDDTSIIGGIAFFHGRPVTVIAHRKGTVLEENMACNFGMPGPEGLRKAQRMMRQAEKFGRPVITLIDTPGAYPGIEAEAHGQGDAIASCLATLSRLRVPVISVVTGEGNSGGALALGVADRILMLENAYFSVLTPEGFASILWKDAARRSEACDVMKLSAQDLFGFGIIDEVIKEPVGGAQRNPQALFDVLNEALIRHLDELSQLDADALTAARYEKFRSI